MRGRLSIPSLSHPAYLLPILALAAILRLFALPQRGLVYWDEAKFALEGIRVASLLEHLSSPAGVVAGKSIGTAKPAHALLIGLAFLILGVHDYAPLWLNALASLISIGLTYFIARTLFDPLVGLLSALLLAVSEYDIIYARSALSESDSVVFLLCAVLVWLFAIRSQLTHARSALPQSAGLLAARSTPTGQAHPLAMFWSGVLLCASFTVNYRMLVYCLVVIGLDLATCSLQQRSFPTRRVLLWLCGFTLPLFIWQVTDLIVRARGAVLFRSEVTGRPVWYLNQALYQLHEGKQSVVHFSPLPYLQWFQLREGWLIAGLVVLGLGLAIGSRRFPWLTAAALVVIPYAVFAFAPFYVPRNLVGALPFACTLAAAALVTLGERLSGHFPLITIGATAVVLTGIGVVMSWRLTAERSGFARAAVWLDRKHQDRALTTTEVMVFYLRGPGTTCDAHALPVTVAGLSAARNGGYRYAVLENHHSSSVSAYVQEQAPRIALFSAVGPLAVGENLISSENSDPPSSRAPPDWVAIYDLSRAHLPGLAGQSLSSCNRDLPT